TGRPHPFTFRSLSGRTLVRVGVYRLGRAPHQGSHPTCEGITVKLTRIAQLGAITAIAALSLTACAVNEPAGDAATTGPSSPAAGLTGTLNATGASSQDAAQQAWVAAFQTTHTGVTVNYQATGSG